MSVPAWFRLIPSQADGHGDTVEPSGTHPVANDFDPTTRPIDGPGYLAVLGCHAEFTWYTVTGRAEQLYDQVLKTPSRAPSTVSFVSVEATLSKFSRERATLPPPFQVP